jgi:integrase
MSIQDQNGMTAANRNEYRKELIGFSNWCVRNCRMLANPFSNVERADTKNEKGRRRRALSAAELERLLYVVRWRPLAELGRESVRLTANELTDVYERGKSRRTWKKQLLTFDTIPAAVESARVRLTGNLQLVAERERLGWERSLIYKVAVLKGLRRGEIESLTVGHLELNGAVPLIRMETADTKNAEAADIPLPAELANDLRAWLDVKRQQHDTGAATGGDVIPMHHTPPKQFATVRLFAVPRQMVKTLDRDLRVAGIAKEDDRGRTVDFHALRHSFGTLLSSCGVAPRTAQQAMRHSTIDLTMNTYTDPRLLDVAIDSLPLLPLSGSLTPPGADRERATGTEPSGLKFAPATVKRVQTSSACDNSVSWGDPAKNDSANPQSTKKPVKDGKSFTGLIVETKRLELSTPALQRQCSPN